MMVLEPVTLSIVDGEQPDANGQELGLVDGDVPAPLYYWFTENGVHPDRPDRWVLVTPAREHPGQLRNLVATLDTYLVRPPVVVIDGQQIPLAELPAEDRARYSGMLTEAARIQMNLISQNRMEALAELAVRDGVEATAARYAMTAGSLRTQLWNNGWGADERHARFGPARRRTQRTTE